MRKQEFSILFDQVQSGLVQRRSLRSQQKENRWWTTRLTQQRLDSIADVNKGATSQVEADLDLLELGTNVLDSILLCGHV